jgi:hypothetical protein
MCGCFQPSLNKSACFHSHVEYKYKQNYIYMQIHTEPELKSGTGGGHQKKNRNIANNNEIYHISVLTRHNETH